MKLAGADASAPHHRGYSGVAVSGGGRHYRTVEGNSGIAVDEIHPRGGVVAVQKGTIAFDFEGGPTHMWNSLVGMDLEPFYGPLEQSQASLVALVAAFEQQLRTKADA